MNAWAPTPSCTASRCITTDGGASRPDTLRRYAALVSAVARATARPGRLDADLGRLRGAALRVLDAVGVTLVAAGDGMAPTPAGTGQPLSVPGAATGTLVVANHLSWLDVIALLAVEPVPLLAKRKVAGWPVIGPLACRAGTRFIDRSGLRALPGTVDELAAQLRAGSSLAVFPQGTTWCSAPGGRFRRATFEAALRAGAPVRPVAISYTRHGAPSTAASFVGDDTFLASLHRVARTAGLTAHVTVCPPLLPPYDGAHNRRSLAATAQHAVTVAAGQPVGQPVGQPAGQTVGQSVGQPAGQPAGETTGQTAGQPERQTAAAVSPSARRSAPALGVAPRPGARFSGMVRRHEGCQ